jgi:glycosyltransferase involved in cell wall biosynthesis
VSQSAPYLLKGITCLIPNKNGASFIGYFERYFQSISDIPLEILIIDDNSTDTSLQLLKSWEVRDSRVKVLSNPRSGLVEALNFGIENSSYDWIARFDIDDEYSPDRLKIQAKLLDDQVTLVFSDYEFMTASGDSFGLMPSPIYHPQIILSLFSNRRTPHSSALFSKSAAISAGMYRKEEFLAEDLALWLRLSELGTLRSSPEPLLKYRISQSSTLGKNRDQALTIRNHVRRNFDFPLLAEKASLNLRQTRDSYLLLSHADERFILHLIEIIEIYVTNKRRLGAVTCIIRAFPFLTFRQLPKLLALSILRIQKNKLQK